VTPLALALLAAVFQPPREPPTFAAGVEAVYVDAFVTDGKGPVTGLTAGQFALRDDGVARPVELVASAAQPLTTLLVLDTSGSVVGEKLAALRGACRVLLGELRDDEVGLLTFSHEIRLRAPPTRDTALVERQLDSMSVLSIGGATALYDALYAATLLARAHGRALVILFTDGEDNLSWLDRADLLPVLESSNVILQAVGIVTGPSPDAGSAGWPEGFGPLSLSRRRALEPAYVRSLRLLAESTGGRFWAAGAPAKLTDAFAAILQAMRTRYVLRFEPEGGRRPGLHSLEVKLVGRRGSVHCRRSYYVGSVEPTH
jgi:VWFA-related protein